MLEWHDVNSLRIFMLQNIADIFHKNITVSNENVALRTAIYNGSIFCCFTPPKKPRFVTSAFCCMQQSSVRRCRRTPYGGTGDGHR